MRAKSLQNSLGTHGEKVSSRMKREERQQDENADTL